jgi:hypothetical protein
MSKKYIQVQPFKLAGSGITSTATTIILQSMKFPGTEDTVLTADLGDICYATLEPNTAREEVVSFTTITQNSDGTATLTGVTRNLDTASPYTQISSTGYAHAGGTLLIVSNNPQVYDDLASNANDETITGTWTFDADAYPKVDDSATPPTDDAEFATKKYADDLAIAGAPDSTTGVKGIVEKATSAETQSGTDTGGTTAPLFAAPSDIAANVQNSKHIYAADAEVSDTYVITLVPAIAAYAAGQSFYFSATTANTGAATLNVNAKGAKTIKKLHDQDLEDGDIEAGSIVHVIYDGTNFQMQTPQATMPTTAILTEASTFFGATDISGAEAEDLTDGGNTSLHFHNFLVGSGTRTTAAGDGTVEIACGFAPKMIKISATSAIFNGATNQVAFSEGSFFNNVYAVFLCVMTNLSVTGSATISSSNIINCYSNSTGWTGTIANITATGFDLVLDYTSGSGTTNLLYKYEVYG